MGNKELAKILINLENEIGSSGDRIEIMSNVYVSIYSIITRFSEMDNTDRVGMLEVVKLRLVDKINKIADKKC